mmetsp:Transcript_54426/g.176044  ORF Transcript_54426/g.176044 Transcript_54426/m.176044 type:complete len:661 (-) Transcript_54426:72-2054(-)
MHVVDFWLDQVVFPVEAKQFAHKLVSTAWDLCRSYRRAEDPGRGPRTVFATGFAGTDDARLLLPPSVQQKALEELRKTNGVVLRNLLREENDEYALLDDTAGAVMLIERLLSRSEGEGKINVVIDPGALVLEYTNAEFAKEWLRQRPDMEGAVYFNDKNGIDVVTRNGSVTPFAVSAHANRLDRCLLYLDDAHTRGSDFRLPIGTRAAVTLGEGMTKDKLVQACMRMRQLGQGHTVSFYASLEVHLHLEKWRSRINSPELSKKSRCLKHLPAILSWCVSNTCVATCDQLPYFAPQGASHVRKQRAHVQSAADVATLATACAEREVLSLREMYSHSRIEELLPKIAGARLIASLGPEANSSSCVGSQLIKQIRARVQALAPHARRHASLLQEEQEKELEQELEEERQLERPPSAEPMKPQVTPGLKRLVQTGIWVDTDEFFPLNGALKGTSFVAHTQQWGEEVFVTSEFVSTVKLKLKNDMYLRRPLWVVVINNGRCLLVSNFEAEKVLAECLVGQARGSAKVQLHLLATRVRPNQPQPLLASEELLAAVHVFAGSFYGDASQLASTRAFAGLCPAGTASAHEWDRLVKAGAIERDFFVPEQHRRAASLADEAVLSQGGFAVCPFTSSPVRMLMKLYAARFLTQVDTSAHRSITRHRCDAR